MRFCSSTPQLAPPQSTTYVRSAPVRQVADARAGRKTQDVSRGPTPCATRSPFESRPRQVGQLDQLSSTLLDSSPRTTLIFPFDTFLTELGVVLPQHHQSLIHVIIIVFLESLQISRACNDRPLHKGHTALLYGGSSAHSGQALGPSATTPVS